MNAQSNVEPLAYSVTDVMSRTGLCRATIYNLINSGRLKSVKVGTRRLVPVSALHELLKPE